MGQNAGIVLEESWPFCPRGALQIRAGTAWTFPSPADRWCVVRCEKCLALYATAPSCQAPLSRLFDGPRRSHMAHSMTTSAHRTHAAVRMDHQSSDILWEGGADYGGGNHGALSSWSCDDPSLTELFGHRCTMWPPAEPQHPQRPEYPPKPKTGEGQPPCLGSWST
jgi:hypothetical protein